MDTTLIIELVTLIVGTNSLTGLVVGLVTIRYQRRKQEGEAHASIYEGMKVEQDTYQQMISDMREAYNGQLHYIGVLKGERSELLQERGELRKQIEEMKRDMRSQNKAYEEERRALRSEVDKLREEVIKGGDKVARLGRIVEAMNPLLCSLGNCKDRERDIISLISDMSFEPKSEDNKKKGK